MADRAIDLHAFVVALEQEQQRGTLGLDIGTPMARLLDTERDAVERAVSGWAAQAGVTVEEWGRSFGFSVRHIYEGNTVTVRVEPVALGFAAGRPLTRIVLPPERSAVAFP